jgi:hypothetical protein
VTTWDERTLVEDAAARGADDWLHVADFVDIVRRFVTEPPEAIRLLALGLIAEVVSDGLMVAGTADEFGFHVWPVASGDAMRQVAELWDSSELCPTPGAVAWFSNTERGNEIGRAVLEREGHLDS